MEKIIRINFKKLIITIIISTLAIEILLALCDIFLSHRKSIPLIFPTELFSLGKERSFGTYFSSLQDLLTGITLIIIYLVEKSQNKKNIMGWLIIGIFFIYMSIDDTMCIHEMCGEFMEYMNNNPQLFKYYYWQVLMGPFFFIMGLFILIFLCYKLKGMKLYGYIITGIVILSLAVLIDLLGNMDDPAEPIKKIVEFINNKTIYPISILIEEYMEMLGVTFMWFVFLKYLESILENGNTLRKT